MTQPSYEIDCLLHDHIDGSIAMLSILPQLYALSGKTIPRRIRGFKNQNDLKRRVKAWFADPRIDIATKFGLVTNVLQNKDTLYMAGQAYVRTRARQGIRYCEGTIAPQYHVFGDNKSKAKLTVREVIEALLEGIRAGEKEFPQIECNILATIGREIIVKRGEDEVLRIFKELSECDPAYVVGRGLVCDEAKYPPIIYVDVLNKARALGYTVDPWCPHAGEWANLEGEDPNSTEVVGRLLDNQRIAIYKMKAARGEHFRLLTEDPELCNFMASNGIGITSCPGGYRMTNNLADLELEYLRGRGVRVSLGPDDDLFMPSISRVWKNYQKAVGLKDQYQLWFRRDAWKLRLGRRKPVPEDIRDHV